MDFRNFGIRTLHATLCYLATDVNILNGKFVCNIFSLFRFDEFLCIHRNSMPTSSAPVSKSIYCAKTENLASVSVLFKFFSGVTSMTTANAPNKLEQRTVYRVKENQIHYNSIKHEYVQMPYVLCAIQKYVCVSVFMFDAVFFFVRLLVFIHIS